MTCRGGLNLEEFLFLNLQERVDGNCYIYDIPVF